MFARPTRPFQRHRLRKGSVSVHLAEAERGLVATLLDDVATLLDPDPSSSDPPEPEKPDQAASDLWERLEASMRVEPPTDPALARLLPDGSKDDPEAAQSYRRLTEQGLRESKRSALRRAATALRRADPVMLDAQEAQALLRGLTDVRLVLAERIGLHTDEDATMLHEYLMVLTARRDEEQHPLSEPEGHWAGLASLYEALTWWQEELVAAVR